MKLGKVTVGIAISALTVLGMSAIQSCGGGNKEESHQTHETVSLKYADNLKISEGKGFTKVTVRNPWDTTKILNEYVLVPKKSDIPADLPKGTIIRTPVDNALVFSTVHISLLKELGALDAIGGICDVPYTNVPEIKERVSANEVANCGSSQNPNVEQIMKMQPKAIFLSPYQNSDQYAKLHELGVPIVECADYMETSPLGRAEWVRFYGMLFGKQKEADAMFAETEKNYLSLKEQAAKATTRPKVLMEQQYGQVWYVPGAESTTGQMIVDAGGINPFGSFKQSGSVALSPEKVLYEAHDADIWFIKYHQNNEKTLAEFAKDAQVNSQFKAFKEGNVYGCNTMKVDFFDETPFHPDRLLEDYISLMHPELNLETGGHHYFKKLN